MKPIDTLNKKNKATYAVIDVEDDEDFLVVVLLAEANFRLIVLDVEAGNRRARCSTEILCLKTLLRLDLVLKRVDELRVYRRLT